MKKGIFTLALTLPTLVMAQNSIENYTVHVLKEGETLSEVLYSNNYKPLYGKDNWVQRVLDLNQLSLDDAPKIKKGYPIFIPTTKAEVAQVEDKVQVKQAATLYHGLVGNRISNHQDLYIDLSYFETAGAVAKYNFKRQSNFKVGLTYQDKNFRKYNNFSYNPEFSFYGIGHGPTQFTNKGDTAASFGPTLQGQFSLMLKHKSVDYNFGPYVEVLERSSLDEIDENIEVRRDQFVSVGAVARKTFAKDHLKFIVQGSIGTSIISNNFNNTNDMQMVTAQFSTDVNLTRDYFIGGFWRNESFAGSAQDNTNSLGINLKYFVK